MFKHATVVIIEQKGVDQRDDKNKRYESSVKNVFLIAIAKMCKRDVNSRVDALFQDVFTALFCLYAEPCCSRLNELSMVW